MDELPGKDVVPSCPQESAMNVDRVTIELSQHNESAHIVSQIVIYEGQEKPLPTLIERKHCNQFSILEDVSDANENVIPTTYSDIPSKMHPITSPTAIEDSKYTYEEEDTIIYDDASFLELGSPFTSQLNGTINKHTHNSLPSNSKQHVSTRTKYEEQKLEFFK